MNPRKVLDKLEHDLSHFMISEMCKNDPTKRGTPEMYKYKGLNITVDTKSKEKDKVVAIRIGVLEAEFKIGTCEKTSGSLNPADEHAIMLWMSQSDNSHQLMRVFARAQGKHEIAIVPFDLEEYYS
mgnify:CR=1 FL=1